MCVCMYVCVRTCMHVSMLAYMCVCVWVCVCTCMTSSLMVQPLCFYLLLFCCCYVMIVSCIFDQNKLGGVAETPTHCSAATHSCPSWWMSWWSLWGCRTFTTPSRSSSTRSVVLLTVTLMLLHDSLSLWACSQALHWPGQSFSWQLHWCFFETCSELTLEVFIDKVSGFVDSYTDASLWLILSLLSRSSWTRSVILLIINSCFFMTHSELALKVFINQVGDVLHNYIDVL